MRRLVEANAATPARPHGVARHDPPRHAPPRGTPQVAGTFSTDTLVLAKVYDVTMGSLSAGSLKIEYGSLSVHGTSYLDDGSLTFSSASFASLAANQFVVGIGCRLGVTRFSSNLLAIFSGGEFDAAGAPVDVGTLQLASASKVSALSGLAVHVTVELAPHFLTQCDHDKGFVPAGSGTLGVPPSAQQNASAVCKWPYHDRPYGVDPYGSHTPAALCRIERKTCGHDHGADLAAPWLDKFTAAHSCLTGPDGTNLFAPSYNWTQACVPWSAART